ncbi:hypothetical protein JAAARDRAFT_28315 [Jaapia argillacea MUCL 33604]|uniref:CUE domain-containing protein n=1 Tax=Jaapia argillacea MUCL 33604 TaxID=933084 RepID=A0A067QC84_9AGAM|nr:hypothetical protein JAAARDRAFT_28315 [Jaapia argillacea MUCL 33604]
MSSTRLRTASQPLLVSNPPVSSSASLPRPNIARQDTDRILSYYQSSDAGRDYHPPSSGNRNEASSRRQRQMSSGTNTPSDYSSDYDDVPTTTDQESRISEPVATGTHRRRPSQPSEGGADKRRLAIVELDSSASSVHRQRSFHTKGANSESTMSRSGSLLTRRGLDAHLRGLALVAPPDASPKTYTNLTPPPTAPARSFDVGNTQARTGSISSHHRSASEVPKPSKFSGVRHKTSRDVGIVGTSPVVATTQRPNSASSRPSKGASVGKETLKPPIFQMPQSRSSSPGVASDMSDNDARTTTQHSQDRAPSAFSLMKQNAPFPTPSIGEGKDVHVGVAGPVVVGLNENIWGRSATSRDADLKLHSITNIQSSSQPARSTVSELSTTSKSSYLHYKPGVHATAGPLPPPPRAIFDIDTSSPPPPRPPRLHSPPPPSTSRRRGDTEAVKQPLQVPESKPTFLSPESSKPLLRRANSDFSIIAVSDNNSTDQIDQPQTLSEPGHDAPSHAPSQPSLPPLPTHFREGAFPPSKFTEAPESAHPQADPVPQETQEMPLPVVPETVAGQSPEVKNTSADVPIPTVIEPPLQTLTKEPDRLAGLDLRREKSWASMSMGNDVSHMTMSSEGETASSSTHSSSAEVRVSRSLSVGNRGAPSLPSAPEKIFKGALTNLKRFSSLPRTPSIISDKKSSEQSLLRSSRIPSPSTLPPLPPSAPKIKSTWPAAMNCGDVLSKRSALDRAIGYAQKINELGRHDCGLGDWVAATRLKGTPRGSASRFGLSPYGPVGPSSRGFTGQPRHTSHGSQGSEATFPIRSDAYTATDLSVRSADDMSLPNGPPPTLPYPSLAISPPTRLTTNVGSPGSLRSPQSPARALGGGFFASIGRKASVRKAGTAPNSPQTSNRLLIKTPPSISSRSGLPSDHPVPGGPRAAPGRVQRSQTIALATISDKEPLQVKASNLTRRQSSAGKRPSFFGGSRSAPPAPNDSDPEFIRQVNKLQDLLPHAERDILAGYLRRAGQDIVAIGQYLEDEKNGSIKRG